MGQENYVCPVGDSVKRRCQHVTEHKAVFVMPTKGYEKGNVLEEYLSHGYFLVCVLLVICCHCWILMSVDDTGHREIVSLST